MRPYLSFPRGTRIPPPRILFHTSDDPALAQRALALATALTEEFATGSIVLATGAADVASMPSVARVDVVKLPGATPRVPERPLALERARRLRQRLLSTLFDVFMPDLLLLDVVGPEAEPEARLLLQRARVFGTATLIGAGHDGPPGEVCSSARERMENVCEPCRSRTCSSAREALSAMKRGRDLP